MALRLFVRTGFQSPSTPFMRRYSITHQDTQPAPTLTIDLQSLKTLRKARKLGRPKLANPATLPEPCLLRPNR